MQSEPSQLRVLCLLHPNRPVPPCPTARGHSRMRQVRTWRPALPSRRISALQGPNERPAPDSSLPPCQRYDAIVACGGARPLHAIQYLSRCRPLRCARSDHARFTQCATPTFRRPGLAGWWRRQRGRARQSTRWWSTAGHSAQQRRGSGGGMEWNGGPDQRRRRLARPSSHVQVHTIGQALNRHQDHQYAVVQACLAVGPSPGNPSPPSERPCRRGALFGCCTVLSMDIVWSIVAENAAYQLPAGGRCRCVRTNGKGQGGGARLSSTPRHIGGNG